jgi:hypothetical protein
MLLIQENTGVLGEDFEIVSTDKDMYIEGIFVKADVPNGNNRIYPKKYLQNGIDIYTRNFINSRKSIGELDHPTPPRSDAKLSERALRVESLEMQSNGYVIGKAIILKGSTKGRELLSIVEEGTSFGTSFRALTQLKNGSDGYVYAGPDIFFRAFDAVLIPSVGEDVDVVSEDIQYENVWYHNNETNIITPYKPSIIEESWKYENEELVLDSYIDSNIFRSTFIQ